MLSVLSFREGALVGESAPVQDQRGIDRMDLSYYILDVFTSVPLEGAIPTPSSPTLPGSTLGRCRG